MIKNLGKNIIVWVIISIGLMAIFNYYHKSGKEKQQIIYSQFIVHEVREGKVQLVTMEGDQSRTGQWLKVKRKDGSVFSTYAPANDELVPELLKNQVAFEAKPAKEQSLLMQIFISWFPMLLLFGLWFFFMRQMQGGGKGGAFSFGKSKAHLLDKDKNKTTFGDVAGCDEAKEEVSEVVDYLSDPKRYQSLGGRIPRGVLLYGSPGTGKTLLAKAIAGEAKVPFFSISGSEFVEMFVGIGASRVRDMFEQAKKNAPCIIFIDEIDAVGRQRGAGLGGGNDEREQTLNQLLVEMDGFETNSMVIVIAATNRPDVLDPALQRPGRFDRQVAVPLPDIRGREQILKVHMRKVPAAKDVEAAILARGTPGFSGADLANLVNEAALSAARRSKTLVEQSDFEFAKDKIMMGAERRSMVMSEDEKRNTAYHEAGHTVVAKLLPKADPVHKVTIIPRGRALGLTMQLPKEDRYAYDKQYLLNNIAILFGGRLAEELFMHQMTTGASHDFEQATQLARNMVTRYGMSDAMGPMVYGENDSEVFLGRSVTTHKAVSEHTMQQIDDAIRQLIDQQYQLARRLLDENRDQVEAMAKALLEWETLDTAQIDDIMAGKAPTPPKKEPPIVARGAAATSAKSQRRTTKASTKKAAEAKRTTDPAAKPILPKKQTRTKTPKA